MGVRHQEQPPVEVALLRRAAARPALRVADRRDQEREAAELVRREDARDEGLGLHRDRRRLGIAERRASVLAQCRERRLEPLAERGVEADAVRRLLRPEDRIEDEVVRGMDADLELDRLVDRLLAGRRAAGSEGCCRSRAARSGRRGPPPAIAAGQHRAGGGTSRPSRSTCRRRSRRCRGTRRCCASRSPTPDRGSAGRPARRCRPPGGTGCRARGRGCSGRARGRETAPPRARGCAAASGPASRSRRRSSPRVAAVHARPDHHHVEVGIGGRLVIGAADEAAEDVEREGRPLDVRLARRKWLAGGLKLDQGHCRAPSLLRIGYDPRAGDVQGAGLFPLMRTPRGNSK